MCKESELDIKIGVHDREVPSGIGTFSLAKNSQYLTLDGSRILRCVTIGRIVRFEDPQGPVVLEEDIETVMAGKVVLGPITQLENKENH